MNNVTKITEIDISKQARALAWLRLTDYALVVLCGFWAIGLLSQLVVDLPSGDVAAVVLDLIMSAILCFATYTGWRHVGVIDPAVWRPYRVVFPLLAVFCLFIGWSFLVTYGSLGDIMKQGRVEAVQQLSGLSYAIYVGSVALLGWISLMPLRRRKVIGMDATVDQVVLGLAKNAGFRAVQASDIKRINKPRGLVIGTAGILVLLALILATRTQ